MIINGNSRGNAKFMSQHLAKTEDNEKVTLTEVRGLMAETIPDAFRQMSIAAMGSRCKNWFYHANINPDQSTPLTPEQWQQAIDKLEQNLGLDGQPRFVVEHEKSGRTHRHVVWLRIDPDTMTARSDSNNYRVHEQTSRELEKLFNHQMVMGAHDRDKDSKRPKRRDKAWESFRGKQTGIDPQKMKQTVTKLYQRADSGKAFAAALKANGFILAKGERRDYVIVDGKGYVHSLARRIDGAKAADITARLADLTNVPTIDQAKQSQRQAQGSAFAQPDTQGNQKERAHAPSRPSLEEQFARALHAHFQPRPLDPYTLTPEWEQATLKRFGMAIATSVAHIAAQKFFLNNYRESLVRGADGLTFLERQVADMMAFKGQASDWRTVHPDTIHDPDPSSTDPERMYLGTITERDPYNAEHER